MSEYFDDPVEDDEDEDTFFGDDDGFETPDEDEEREFGEGMESILSQYREESAEYNAAQQQFAERYGFKHDCHCDQDWEEGNLGVVSMCYLGMVADAMETLANARDELKEVKRENGRLKIQLAG